MTYCDDPNHRTLSVEMSGQGFNANGIKWGKVAGFFLQHELKEEVSVISANSYLSSLTETPLSW